MDQSYADELLDIADQASSEGDKATASAALARYKEITRGPWHPVGAPLYRPKGNAEEGMMDPNLPQYGQRPFRAAAAGATRLVTGPGQVMTAAGEAMGIPGANVKEYTQGVNALEQQVVGGQMTPEEQTSAMGGEAVSGVLAPGASGGKAATTFIKAAPRMFGASAAGAAQNFDPSAETAGDVGTNIGVGTALGGVIPALSSIKGAASNWFGRLFSEVDPSVAGTKAQMVDPNFQDFPLSVAQQKGTEFARKVESQVAGQSAKEFYNKQLESLRNRFKNNIPQNEDPTVMAARMASAIRSTEASMQGAASQAYGSKLDEAMTLAARNRQPIRGTVQRTQAEFQTMMNNAPDAWREVLETIPAKERDLIVESFKRLENGNTRGVVSLDSLITLHRAAKTFQTAANRAYNSGTTPTPKASEMYRFGRDIMKSLDADIDDLRKVNGQTDAAWTKFEEARDGYKQFIKAREELEASVVKQAFGFAPKDAEQAWTTLLKSDPRQQTVAINMLRRYSPETVADIKRWKLNDVAKQMLKPAGEADVSKVDPKEFVNQLMDGSEVVGKAFWTAPELARIQSSVAAAQVLMTRAPSQRRVVEGEGALMAAASASTAFIARVVYRMAVSGEAEKLFFTPAGQKALLEARELATTGRKMSAASLGWFTSQNAEGAMAAVQPPGGAQ